MANHETAMQTPQNGIDGLVSDQAAGAATGAFAKLSQAVHRTPPELSIADDSGRTTEQFIEDMMRPMLREWLDQNLPAMVERIVQREIQKIVRRAED
jgi:cell pole-organizing protein PopZ